MRLSEAIEEVRKYIGDLGGENWTDKRVCQAIQTAIRKVHAKAIQVNPEWQIQTIQITPSDLETTDEGTIYKLPFYVSEIYRIMRGDIPTLIYPKLNRSSISGYGWRMASSSPRAVLLSANTTELQAYTDSPRNYYWLQYRGPIWDQFKGESGNTSPATSTANWVARNLTVGKITELADSYRGAKLAFQHGGVWTTGIVLTNTSPASGEATFTVDAAATIEENDPIETILPFDSLLDDPIAVVAAFTLLTWEGHQRGQDRLAALYAEAMEQVGTVAGDLGKSQDQVEIAW